MNSNLERENYDFIGWTCDKDSSQTPSKYLDIMTNWQSNITLTAHWQPKQQYVYYYLDGGVFSDDITTPEIIKHDSGISYSLSILKATISRFLHQQNPDIVLSVGQQAVHRTYILQ